MTLRFQKLTLDQYRCFERLELNFEPDITLLFGENGGGKSAVLHALAVGLAAIQRDAPRSLKLTPTRDARMITLDEGGRREAAGSCKITWTAQMGTQPEVIWWDAVNPASDSSSSDHTAVSAAIEEVRAPGACWPLFAFYGIDRMRRGEASTQPARARPDRWEGYASSLRPEQDDSALLTWLLEELLSDTVRSQQGEPQRLLATAVMDTVVSATPGVRRAWYNPRERSPVIQFDGGQVSTWNELSDGFHIYLSLVADIARRAIILNEQHGANAPSLTEGVVLIDEIDLHLHPRWQRVVLDGLRSTFPKLQFVITTHSPQVLSSALNRQVRHLVDGRLQGDKVFVEGRDTNAILRELMHTTDRNSEGQNKLRSLHESIDNGDRDTAERLLADLLKTWGDLDPALVYARGLMDWED